MPKHVKQLVSYERACGVPRGILWYENKDNQHTKAFIVRYDDGSWHEVEGWCQSVLSFLERRKLPPKHPDCSQGNIAYERCQYSQWCYGSRMDATELRDAAYSNFTTIDEAWEAGHAASGDL